MFQRVAQSQPASPEIKLAVATNRPDSLTSRFQELDSVVEQLPSMPLLPNVAMRVVKLLFDSLDFVWARP